MDQRAFGGGKLPRKRMRPLCGRNGFRECFSMMTLLFARSTLDCLFTLCGIPGMNCTPSASRRERWTDDPPSPKCSASDPSQATTLWHGTEGAKGLMCNALPTARAPPSPLHGSKGPAASGKGRGTAQPWLIPPRRIARVGRIGSHGCANSSFSAQNKEGRGEKHVRLEVGKSHWFSVTEVRLFAEYSQKLSVLSRWM